VALCPGGKSTWSRPVLAFVQSRFPRIKIELFVGIGHQKSVGVNLSSQLGRMGMGGRRTW